MNHKDLDVWKLSIDLVTEIYTLTKTFLKEEIHGSSEQLTFLACKLANHLETG